MNVLINWIVSALVILSISIILPGIHVVNFTTALVTALVLGIINAVLKPIFLILTLPINVVTFGLFTLVINASLIMITTKIVNGFTVDSFWWAILFSVALSIVNAFLHT